LTLLLQQSNAKSVLLTGRIDCQVLYVVLIKRYRPCWLSLERDTTCYSREQTEALPNMVVCSTVQSHGTCLCLSISMCILCTSSANLSTQYCDTYKYHVVYFLIRHFEIFMSSCCRYCFKPISGLQTKIFLAHQQADYVRNAAPVLPGKTRTKGGPRGRAPGLCYISDLHLLATVSHIVHT